VLAPPTPGRASVRTAQLLQAQGRRAEAQKVAREQLEQGRASQPGHYRRAQRPCWMPHSGCCKAEDRARRPPGPAPARSIHRGRHHTPAAARAACCAGRRRHGVRRPPPGRRCCRRAPAPPCGRCSRSRDLRAVRATGSVGDRQHQRIGCGRARSEHARRAGWHSGSSAGCCRLHDRPL